MRVTCTFVSLVLAAVVAGEVGSQPVPQPFPRPGSSQPTPAAPATPAQPQSPAAKPAGAPAPAEGTAPDAATLGVPVYPTAQYIASYDAGAGQRYYLFGSSATFTDLVSYYRTVLKSRGELLYEEPPIHTFDIGRFREETMAFPPSVTVKDYTWGGAQGYLVPLPGGKSLRYPTIIQIVPAAPGR
jgi:hypothetical protein